ncbi:MAG: hypothetical protein ABIQ88_04190 [Chitinophagaceae bacterium]
MNRYFLWLMFGMLAVACNNQPANPEITALEKAPVTIQKDSVSKTDTAITAFSYGLTASEKQDDSTFTDGSQPATWANAGFEHPIEFKKFLKRLQYWVANQQADSVAAVVAFPLKNPPVINKAAFVAKYDAFINEKVKTALMAQNMRQIFRNGQGAMLGNGAIWFRKTSKGFTITSINN